MIYYCIANPIQLVKEIPSINYFDSIPHVGIPTYSKLPVNEARMREAFAQSEEIILCRTLADAMILRQAKLNTSTCKTPDFFNNTCPTKNYAIYEVEINDEVKVNFSTLINATAKQLQHLVSRDLYITAVICNDRSKLPNIDFYFDNKAATKPKLIQCHYFPVLETNDTECRIF